MTDDALTVDPLLAAALVQADRSSPPVRAAALVHIARVLHAIDPPQSDRVFERGLAVAATLGEPVRGVIIGEAAAVAATVAPPRALKLLQSLPSNREAFGVADRVLINMALHGDVDAATAYLINLPASAQVPFHALSTVMGLAKNQETRRSLLRVAFAGLRPGDEMARREVTRMFQHSWRILPADDARTFVHRLLSAIEAQPDGRTNARVNEVRFTSSRQYEWFNIFGPLRHLDPSRAEALLPHHPQLAAAVARYPFGMESMFAPELHTGPPQSAPPPIEEPDPSNDFVVLDNAWVPMVDALRSDFAEPFATALGTLAIDSDSTRPNNAPKECWPSAVALRSILHKAGKYEGLRAARLLERIPDADLRLFAQIELAAAIVGLSELGSRSLSWPAPTIGEAASPSMSSQEGRFEPSFGPPPPLERPGLPPSREVRIAVSTRASVDGLAGGSGPDFWVMAGARLRPVLSSLLDVPATRIELPPDLERQRFDFTLVLPEPVSSHVMRSLMREGLERHFGIARRTVVTNAHVLRAPRGIEAPSAASELPGGFGGGIAFASSGIAVPHGDGVDGQALAEAFQLMNVMDLTALDDQPGGEWPTFQAAVLQTIFALGGGVTSIDDSPMTIGTLCRWLEAAVGQPVVDETGLSGRYRIHALVESGDAAGLLAMVTDRLGLTIDREPRPIDMIVVSR